MEPDVLAQVWQEFDRRLEGALRVRDDQARVLARAGRRMRHLEVGLALKTAAATGLTIACGAFAVNHVASSGLLASAVGVGAYFFGSGMLAVRQIVHIRRVDWAQPVTTIQIQLELLRVERARTVLIEILIGIVLWAPMLAIAVAAVGGIDLLAVAPAWMWMNVAFGIVAVVLALWWSRRRARTGRPLNARLVKVLAGTSIQSAIRKLAEVREFREAD